MYKSNLIFAVLSNILVEKSMHILVKQIASDDFTTVSKFLILRYLSMSFNEEVRNIVIDNYITLERMPEKQLYKWLLKTVPKQNSSFIRYIK